MCIWVCAGEVCVFLFRQKICLNTALKHLSMWFWGFDFISINSQKIQTSSKALLPGSIYFRASLWRLLKQQTLFFSILRRPSKTHSHWFCSYRKAICLSTLFLPRSPYTPELRLIKQDVCIPLQELKSPEPLPCILRAPPHAQMRLFGSSFGTLGSSCIGLSDIVVFLVAGCSQSHMSAPKHLTYFPLSVLAMSRRVDGVQLHRSWLQPSAALYLGRSEEVLCGLWGRADHRSNQAPWMCSPSGTLCLEHKGSNCPGIAQMVHSILLFPLDLCGKRMLLHSQPGRVTFSSGEKERVVWKSPLSLP